MNLATLVKVISTSVDSMNRRVVKFLRLGKSDVQTALETAPFGVDGNAPEGMIAMYASTSEKGKTIIVGYINKNQLAGVGELRLYSTDENGEEQFYTWLKNDGTMELGGIDHNLMRFSPTKQAMDQLALDINTQLALIATGIAAGGGSYSPGNISIDISDSKIDEIKTL